LAATANSHYRHEAWIQRQDVSFVPFDGYLGPDVNTAAVLRKLLDDRSSGVDLPAAIILETVQAEGGVNLASRRWLQEVAEICRERDILVIVDDIQVGCGRTGSFFSFEAAGIKPDIVVLSKSIGGYGLPMSLLLIRPETDQWKPGEHTGTFRGNNLAFVAATEALRYWETPELTENIGARGRQIAGALQQFAAEFPALGAKVRGTGLIWGLEFAETATCQSVAREAFAHRLIIETCGSNRNVLKLLPPLVIDETTLGAGLRIIHDAIRQVTRADASAKLVTASA
jgi:diaminobutyrate-2-oxoglutarate transaminase